MAFVAKTSKKIPLLPISIALLAIAALVAAFAYLNKPASQSSVQAPASREAKAYVSHLPLSDVTMRATENFMKQEVVEIQGKIGNTGDQRVRSVDVYCLFYGVDGREIYRERVPIVRSKGELLKPGETRPFRLAFDSLPDGWNQALPHLVIAEIAFGR